MRPGDVRVLAGVSFAEYDQGQAQILRVEKVRKREVECRKV